MSSTIVIKVKRLYSVMDYENDSWEEDKVFIN